MQVYTIWVLLKIVKSCLDGLLAQARVKNMWLTHLLGESPLGPGLEDIKKGKIPSIFPFLNLKFV
jgi:hypothetical protein